MTEPTLFLADETLLENELEKLYALQDKPSKKQTREIMVRELLGSGYPIKAILSGIRHLMVEDVSHLRYTTIIGAARKYMAPEEQEGPPCSRCMGGVVVFYDERGREFALACQCHRGAQKASGQGLKRWDGGDTYMSPKNGLLSRNRESLTLSRFQVLDPEDSP